MNNLGTLFSDNFHIIIYVWYALFFIMLFKVFVRYDMERKRDFRGRYYKDIPNYYGPEVLSSVLSGKVRTNSFSAAILNLVRKGGLLLNYVNNTYYLCPNNAMPNKFTKAELELVDFLVNRIGDKTKVSVNDIKKMARSRRDGAYFIARYNNWIEASVFESKKYRVYLRKPISPRVIIFGIIGIFISVESVLIYKPDLVTANVNEILGILMFILAIFLPSYMFIAKTKTKEALEEYYKWRALRRYLKTYSIKKISANEVSPELIDKYLVYSIILGVNKKMRADIFFHRKEYLKIESDMKIKIDFFLQFNSLDRSISRAVRINKKQSKATSAIRIRTKNSFVNKAAKENDIGDRGIGF